VGLKSLKSLYLTNGYPNKNKNNNNNNKVKSKPLELRSRVKICECIYDRKLTKFAAKKSHLVVEIATTIGNLKTTTILLYLHCLTTN
jgi:hypothetical protein